LSPAAPRQGTGAPRELEPHQALGPTWASMSERRAHGGKASWRAPLAGCVRMLVLGRPWCHGTAVQCSRVWSLLVLRAGGRGSRLLPACGTRRPRAFVSPDPGSAAPTLDVPRGAVQGEAPPGCSAGLSQCRLVPANLDVSHVLRGLPSTSTKNLLFLL
jgi:hypothetical protein